MERTFVISKTVRVSCDESKFTPEFMENFSKHFHTVDDIAGHLEYIAESVIHGSVSRPSDFLEGYGVLDKNFGVKFEIEYTDVEDITHADI